MQALIGALSREKGRCEKELQAKTKEAGEARAECLKWEGESRAVAGSYRVAMENARQNVKLIENLKRELDFQRGVVKKLGSKAIAADSPSVAVAYCLFLFVWFSLCVYIFLCLMLFCFVCFEEVE